MVLIPVKRQENHPGASGLESPGEPKTLTWRGKHFAPEYLLLVADV